MTFFRPSANVCSYGMGRARTPDEIEKVARLRRTGLTQREVSLKTGVPLSTIQKWARGLTPTGYRRRHSPYDCLPTCERCDIKHEATGPGYFCPATYAYLLGLYLGDGDISRNGSAYALRLTLDVAYPGIIAEAAAAIREIAGRMPWIRASKVSECAHVGVTWRAWPCIFPQHGPGRKHTRPIVLEPWQREIVTSHAGVFARGLIQTDGWRGLNRVHVKGRDYAYPRYQFSNRSDDIRTLFTEACDQLGVEWRPWGRWHISVARRDSVARLDEFVGPKR